MKASSDLLGLALGLALRNVLFVAGWLALVWSLHLQMGGGFFGLLLAGFIVGVWMKLAHDVIARVVARKK